ncbi:MAG: prolyl oligopeptidase family serine peptidase [Rhodothermales bacterium]|nr:prolyl oligopeptidase family serine peptidase [Rhodothermales bacterium]
MNRLCLFAAVLFVTAPALGQQAITYPETRRGDVVDDYHGTAVADPYRWLEDLDGDETRAWVAAQNALTFGYLEGLPQRDAFKDRLTTLWDYPKYGAPSKKGSRYFFSKNDGLQNQSVIYVQESLGGTPRVLIDPNTFSEDGTVALSGLYVSDDGRYAAYSISESGSDWRTFRVRDVDTGEDLPDVLRWIKFSGASWDADGAGFYYSRYDAPEDGEDALAGVNKNQKLYYHRLGTDQADDVLVYERPDQPEWGFAPEVTDDGRYLVVTVWQGTDERTRVYVRDLRDPDGPITPLLDDFDAAYDFIGNTGTAFYFVTDRDAPNKRLVAIDLARPGADAWTTLLPESERVIRSVDIVHDRFVVSVLDDVKGRMLIHGLDGAFEREIELPTLGSVYGGGERDASELFYTFTSFTYPPTIYRYDFETGASEVFRQAEVDFDPEAYVTKQVFYESKDGTRVPMFIVHRKDLALDGQNPTYLYAYGGFNISLTPGFSVSNLAWLEQGGVYAMPNLRGGGEYGEAWHKAGMLGNKQNVFDDFIAAAEYLIDAGYTSTPKLAIGGGSNGGLLVGAVLTQRPDLFGAALPAVGVMDMLRFHQFTIGWAWVSEYGSAEDPEQFRWLRAYSPLHNLKPGTHYPPTLVTTADHDDRVVPGHSYKFAAAMQHAQGGPAPVLIRIETKAGHGAGKPTSKIIEEQADKWAFLAHVLGMPMPQALPAGTGVDDAHR